jgi:hypothetical protein
MTPRFKWFLQTEIHPF